MSRLLSKFEPLSSCCRRHILLLTHTLQKLYWNIYLYKKNMTFKVIQPLRENECFHCIEIWVRRMKAVTAHWAWNLLITLMVCSDNVVKREICCYVGTTDSCFLTLLTYDISWVKDASDNSLEKKAIVICLTIYPNVTEVTALHLEFAEDEKNSDNQTEYEPIATRRWALV